ncbi:MAG: translation initiation factor 2 [Candidatus Onthomonas sp.]|nr:translation initiation factor 2 [Candidatus Onthomonas sp.]
MVKGISRRVIVVRSPDPRFFEQAIFLMKEDAFHNGTVSADQVVAEARQAAAGYIRRNAEGRQKKRRQLPGAIWFLLGGGVIAVAWGLSWLLL